MEQGRAASEGARVRAREPGSEGTREDTNRTYGVHRRVPCHSGAGRGVRLEVHACETFGGAVNRTIGAMQCRLAAGRSARQGDILELATVAMC